MKTEKKREEKRENKRDDKRKNIREDKRKNKIAYILYGIIGILLMAGFILTGTYGLSEVNKKAYDSFAAESSYMSKLGFKDFYAADDTVRFFDGEKDYVVKSNGEITREKKVLDVLAATAWKVGEEYQILVPVYENMSGFTKMAENVEMITSSGENDNQTSKSAFSGESDSQTSKATFSEEFYVAAICHEAFHVWQFNHFEEQINRELGEIKADREEVITSEIDSNSEYVNSIEQEVKLLFEAYYETDMKKKLKLVGLAMEEEDKRRSTMNENSRRVEYYIENLEGSAQYVEAMVYKDLTSQKEFEDYYLEEFTYVNGSYKYYTIGLMKCLILDQMDESLQEKFTYENGLSQIMKGIEQK